MSEKKNLVCIVCPQGCNIEIEMDGMGIERITGYKCRRGQEYARQECINPVRTITTTVRLVNGKLHVAPVKSDRPIPKKLMCDCVREINKCSLQAPVKIGDVVIENVLGTGANIVVTSNVNQGDVSYG